MIKHRFTYLLIILIIGLVSCKKDPEVTELKGSEYIPLKVGNYFIYDVSNITFSSNYTYDDDNFYPAADYTDTSIYQLKEELSAKDTDLEGNEFFKISRYLRANSSETWALDSIWKCQVNGTNFIRTENNVNYIKLNFPIQRGRSWDGYALNIYNSICDEFTYGNFIDYNNGVTTFEDVAQVVMCSDTNDIIVDHNEEVEYYAKDIGLVYRYDASFKYCQLPPDSTLPNCAGLAIIDNGYIYTKSIVDYHLED